MNILSNILKTAVDSLSRTSQTPLLDSEILLAHVLKKPRIFLQAWPMHEISEMQKNHFFDLIEKRNRNVPIAYLTGSQPFWSLNFSVNEATLIPRPETEHLVELALTKLDKNQAYRIVDLGTGSGAVGLAIAKERPNSEVFATDISQAALDVARFNAKQLGIKNIQFYHGHWCHALPPNQYDLILSNPPYVAKEEQSLLSAEVHFEPAMALFSEENGLKDIRCILSEAPFYLKSGAHVLLEHGFLQGGLVRSLFKTGGFKKIFTYKDYAGYERVSCGICIK